MYVCVYVFKIKEDVFNLKWLCRLNAASINYNQTHKVTLVRERINFLWANINNLPKQKTIDTNQIDCFVTHLR